jgi:hypothetical protein
MVILSVSYEQMGGEGLATLWANQGAANRTKLKTLRTKAAKRGRAFFPPHWPQSKIATEIELPSAVQNGRHRIDIIIFGLWQPLLSAEKRERASEGLVLQPERSASKPR